MPEVLTACVEWQGALSDGRYGQRRPRAGARSRTRMVHRQVWEEHYGPVPDGQVIRHLCHNTRCYNIGHLAIGTQADNMRDMRLAGRDNFQSGDECGSSKLTSGQVAAIRQRYNAGGVTQKQLGTEYGVAEATIRSIIIRRTWR